MHSIVTSLFQQKCVLPKSLEPFRHFNISETSKHNKLIFAVFRNVCSLLWMLHTRDKLSSLLRMSTALLQTAFTVDDEVCDTHKKNCYPYIPSQETLLVHSLCVIQLDVNHSMSNRQKKLEKSLTWCLKYLPFSQYLDCTNELCEVMCPFISISI